MVAPDLRDVGARRVGLGHNRRLLPGRSGPPTLAPGDQFKTLIARASVPFVMPGLSHDDVPSPPREHGRIRRRQPRSECGSAKPLSESWTVLVARRSECAQAQKDGDAPGAGMS